MSKNILVIAAHPDDEILGCGGTIARHSNEKDRVKIIFIADGVGARSDNFEHNLKARKESANNAANILGVQSIEFLDFPDNQLDTIPLLSIVKQVEHIIKQFKPEIVYTHCYDDLNIDHQITHRATMTACRPASDPGRSVKEIYAYEVVSSTELGLQRSYFKPNYFVDIDAFFSKKIEALKAYSNEMRAFPHSRSLEHIEALSIHRGATIGLNKAEAFLLERAIRDM